MSDIPASEVAEMAQDRVSTQTWRLQEYETLIAEYRGSWDQNGLVRGQYGDGRPALQDLETFGNSLRSRPGAPNWIKPIIDDRVALMCALPTITFDQASNNPEDQKQAELASIVVRGQYEISRMAVQQVRAAFFATLLGETAYTLDPLRPSEAKKRKSPFALPGVRINVQDPRFCFPEFGTGDEFDIVQSMVMFYRGISAKDVYRRYPQAKGQSTADKFDIVVLYDKDYKCTVLNDGRRAIKVEDEDYDYGFCPAAWGVNKTAGTQWGISEVDQTMHLHRNSQALFHLAMDGAILATFPPIHVHNAEHVGRVTYGPGAIIESSEDGNVNPLQSQVNPQIPVMLLDTSTSNLTKQTGTSPIRQDMNIQHANTSGRAIHGAQGAMEARIAMANILLGSTLELINSMVAIILNKDSEFRNAQMSVFGVKGKTGDRVTVDFTGEQLGGIWRNHVQWADPLGSNKHEVLVMYLQLYKEGLVSGRKVLEAVGEDNPETLLREAKLDQQQKQQLMQAMQAGQGGQPPGGPTDAAQQGVALGAGAMPGGGAVPQGSPGGGGGPEPQPGATQPPPGATMPGFPPSQAPPGGSPAPSMSGLDIWSAVQSAASGLKLHGQVTGAHGTPTGIQVTVTDHRDFAILKTALRTVAESVAGPGAKVDVQLEGK